jgi:DNA ligase-4
VHKTLPFHVLFTTLFNPLNEQRKKPGGPAISRKKQGPHGKTTLSPHEARRNIIERFISRWRSQVGNDIYPAFRLIVPEKDRDRAMYGLKEKTIGKLLVKVIGIDKNSEDAYNLMNWKLPGFRAAATAGDFAARCYDVLQKRPILTSPGTMTIAEVNERLDKLAAASKENEQMPLFEEFYRRMNPEELMWLVRMMLRQMKIGATEKTFFDIWHDDAESLFNVSSSLRRVCWELYDRSVRLDSDQSSVTLMQCFQPQLANFQSRTFERMVESMRPTEDDDEFWIEEKLDGERMQLHMVEDESVPGGKRFNFWSRKGKDYTYLYGSGFEDDSSSLTRHLKNGFNEGVRNIILDGEMITWDMEEDCIVAFGTLKTAALSESKNPYQPKGQRPLFRVFDCLYLNDKPITQYTMRDRRAALEQAVNKVDRRMEIHEFTVAHKASEIEPQLRKVVAASTEGLVLKNPRSAYKLSERNDDWWKVKPEYMTEFGEALDCVVIGGYYGSGHRGGVLSSFLCGLRAREEEIKRYNLHPQHCWSFFKVGGGMSAMDYREIREATTGKWTKFDPRRPPTEYISLAGGDRQYERPDMWIKPEDSVVVEVKAASVGGTDQFRTGFTLRFPRFKRVRRDKTWQEALSLVEFIELKSNAESKHAEKEFQIDDERKKQRAATSTGRKKRKPLSVHGAGKDGDVTTPYAGPDTKLFEGMTFFIISDALKPFKKSKQDLEALVKANGGSIVQSQSAVENVICIGDRNVVKASAIKKEGKLSIVRPAWLYDCIEQAALEPGQERFLLPWEKGHMLHVAEEDEDKVEGAADEFGDSYCRDVGVEELKRIFGAMPMRMKESMDGVELMGQFEERGVEFTETKGSMFRHVVAFVDQPHEDVEMVNGSSEHAEGQTASSLDMELAKQQLAFGGAKVVESLDDPTVTHVVAGQDKQRLEELRKEMFKKQRLPRLVTMEWVLESWKEKTLLDEERFLP